MNRSCSTASTVGAASGNVAARVASGDSIACVQRHNMHGPQQSSSSEQRHVADSKKAKSNRLLRQTFISARNGLLRAITALY